MPQLNLYGFDMTLALAILNQVNADAGGFILYLHKIVFNAINYGFGSQISSFDLVFFAGCYVGLINIFFC